MILDVHVAHC